MMDMLCLKWSNIGTNISNHFRKLREDKQLLDITLATDDGQQIQAHKIILSAGSKFFRDIFLKSNQTNMLIYLKGIRNAEVECITDFLYNREVFIPQEDLKQFLEIGKELQVEGLLGEVELVNENNHDYQMNNSDIDTIKENNEDQTKHDNFILPVDDIPDSDVVKANHQNKDLCIQIEELIEKDEGLWTCKVCRKTTIQKSGIKSHAELHINGLLHSCTFCCKTFPSRAGLTTHISHIHSEQFCCAICGKSDMNRMAYNNHKRRKHLTRQ